MLCKIFRVFNFRRTYYHTVINAANCRVPLADRNVALNYNSTLEGFVLTLICSENDAIADEVLNATCNSSGKWIPDPAQFTCSSFILQLYNQVQILKY